MSTKPHLLWNVQQPDDPYDIKKSMIARLPDHPPKPMGAYLQMVCLLQAAQIQRLTDYLTQIKSKYRELERRELDRHSYEVQIKELAERNLASGTLKTQNQRLKDYIRRQTLELEETRKLVSGPMSIQALQAKYEGVLNELRVAREQRERSEVAMAKLGVEVGEWRGKLERCELQHSVCRGQLSEMRTGRQRAEERAEKLQTEMRQVREMLESKNHEIQGLSKMRDELDREIRLLEQKNRNRGSIEGTINQLNRQIQRITLMLNDKSNRLDKTTASLQKYIEQNRILQQRCIAVENEKDSLVNKLRQAEKSLAKRQDLDRYQDKIVMLSMEIERLKGMNQFKARDISEISSQLQRLRSELHKINVQKDQAERERDRLKTFQHDAQLKASQEIRISMISQQLQRLNAQFVSKNGQVNVLLERIKILQPQNNKLKQEIQAARTESRNYRSITESELNTIRTDNAKLKLQLEQYHGSRMEGDRFKFECDKLKIQVDRLRNEGITLRRTTEEERMTNGKLAAERARLADENKKIIEDYRRSTEDIKRLIEDNKRFNDDNRRISEDNKRLTQENKRPAQDIRRLMEDSKRLGEDNKRLSQDNKRLAEDNRRLAEDSRRLADDSRRLAEDNRRLAEQPRRLSAQLSKLRSQVQSLRASIQDGQSRQALIHDLQSSLQKQITHSEQLQQAISKIIGQIDRLQAVIVVKTSENMRISKDCAQWEQKCKFLEAKLANSVSEKEFYEREMGKIKIEVDGVARLGREAQLELERRSGEFSVERERFERVLSQNERLMGEQHKERELFQRKIRELQQMLASKLPQLELTKGELDRIRQQLRGKQEKTRLFESRVTEWQSRFKDAQRGIYLRDQQKNSLFQDNQRLTQELAKTKQEFSRNVQEITQAKQEIARLGQQVSRLTELGSRNRKEQQLRVQLQRAQDTLTMERRQRQNMRQQCQNLHRDIQAIRPQVRRNEDLLTRQNRQLETLRQGVKEYQLKIVHIESANAKHLQERLRQEVRDHEARLQDKDNVIAGLEKDRKQMEKQMEILIQRDRNTLNNLNHYQQQIGLLSVELERLNGIISVKSNESKDKDKIIESYQTQINNLTAQLNSPALVRSEDVQKYRIQIANLKTALSQLQNINLHTLAERDQLFNICHQLKTEFDLNTAKLAEQQRRLRSQLQLRAQQSRRFGQEIGQLRKKQQSHLNRIRQLQDSALRQEEPLLRRRIAQLESSVSTYIRETQQLKTENTNLASQVRQLELMLQEERSKGEGPSRQLLQLKERINELTKVAREREEEIGLWEGKYTGLYTAYEQLYHNFNLTKGEYEVTINNVRLYEAKLFKLEEDFSVLNESLRTARAENEGLRRENAQLRSRQQSDEDLYQKNILLSKEIDRLVTINKGLKAELEEVRIRMTDNVSLSKRIEEHMALFVVLFAEIEALRSRLANSEHECEEVRRKSLIPLRMDRSRSRT